MPSTNPIARFPLRYVERLLEVIAGDPNIAVITYDDFYWPSTPSPRSQYPGEFLRWRAADPAEHKIHLLIQYDVDQVPHRTRQLLQIHSRLGIPANIMVFREPIDRNALGKRNEVVRAPYDLDFNAFRQLAKASGSTIGYHSNAVERAGHDLNLAADVFAGDLKDLRREFGHIRYVSAHGGVPNSDGINNVDLPPEIALDNGTLWVHNRYTPFFDGHYSDGGLASPARSAIELDLMRFCRTWLPGGRYRILLHPQYYDTSWIPMPRLMRASWYRKLTTVDPATINWQIGPADTGDRFRFLVHRQLRRLRQSMRTLTA